MSKVRGVVGLPPEVNAYALARYSRSADSFENSVGWIKRQAAQDQQSAGTSFMETFYFGYGHKSIADGGHPTLTIEDVSQMIAEELEDEQLWDGQEKSTRYQDFSTPNFQYPANLSAKARASFERIMQELFATYALVAEKAREILTVDNQRPTEMSSATYKRAIKARAFDVARYLLPLATKTNFGQVTSIRTLEKQIRRLLASPYAEVRVVGQQMQEACRLPAYNWPRQRFIEIVDKQMDAGVAVDVLVPLRKQILSEVLPEIQIAPTLAKHLAPDEYLHKTRQRLKELAASLLPEAEVDVARRVDLVPRDDYETELVITALYWVSHFSYRQIRDYVLDDFSEQERQEVLKVLVAERGAHDELLRVFAGGQSLAFDLCIDIGDDRDLKRHRRCIQVRQDHSSLYGYEVPELLKDGRLATVNKAFVEAARAAEMAFDELASESTEAYLVLPFCNRRRRLFKMDPAELCYITELRTKTMGNISYRRAAYEMFLLAKERYPHFCSLFEQNVTHPSEQAPLLR